MLPAYFGTLTYNVLPGDSLFMIAKKFNTTIENILKFNDIPNINMIRTGQQIVVPLAPPEAIVYTVRPGDSLYNIALRYGTFVDNLIRYNYLAPPYIIYPGQQLVVTASLK
nr:LysM peptidoglycan-binding domain-containing protein [Sedimentibacter sp.]